MDGYKFEFSGPIDQTHMLAIVPGEELFRSLQETFEHKNLSRHTHSEPSIAIRANDRESYILSYAQHSFNFIRISKYNTQTVPFVSAAGTMTYGATNERLPITEADVSKLHRIFSNALAGLNMVVPVGNEETVLSAFNTDNRNPAAHPQAYNQRSSASLSAESLAEYGHTIHYNFNQEEILRRYAHLNPKFDGPKV